MSREWNRNKRKTAASIADQAIYERVLAVEQERKKLRNGVTLKLLKKKKQKQIS
jgi:hypothetical protein